MRQIQVLLILLILIAVVSFTVGENRDRKKKMAALGKLLFNEKILSLDSSISCAGCHKPDFAFADTSTFSIGIHNKLTKRNTPSVLNMQFRPYFFWDGRAATLEEQSLMPIQNPEEMGLSIEQAVERLNHSAFYLDQFKKVFHQKPTKENLSLAIAAFEETLETTDSKFDDWSYNKAQLTEQEERGRLLFISDKSKCFECHRHEDFTTDDFRNIGLFNGKDLNDSGRYNITKDLSDIGKFKVPGLRNIAVTGPYMHNGMFKTLEEVIDFYNDVRKKIPDAVNLDPALEKPLGLTEDEKADLVAFLKTLTDKKFARQKN